MKRVLFLRFMFLLYVVFGLLLTTSAGTAVESLAPIRAAMEQYAAQLSAGQSDRGVQERGAAIVTLLETLLEEEKKAGEEQASADEGESGEGDSDEASEAEEQESASEQQKSQAAQAVTNEQPVESAAASSISPQQGARPNGKGAGEVNLREQTQGDWGGLPPEEREAVLQKIDRRFPQSYREILESYFRNIAR